MKIALSQINYRIGDFKGNQQLISAQVEQAKLQGARLVVFSEMAVCGYPPMDLIEYKAFVDQCNNTITEIASGCQGIAAIVGGPHYHHLPKGNRLFNAAWFLAEGEVKKVVHKTMLPACDVFDERRYFEPNDHFELIEYDGERIALTIGEDLWDVEKDPININFPMDELASLHPTLMINIAATPFRHHLHSDRRKMLSKNALQYQLPLIYVNQTGANTDLLFDGNSMILNNKGEVVQQLKIFAPDFVLTDTTSVNRLPALNSPEQAPMEQCYNALVMGIKDYFHKLGFKKAILGLSGGLDSAVLMVLAAEALGADNVTGLLMPSRYSSDHSITDATQLAKNLGSPYETISIEESFITMLTTLEPSFRGTSLDVTEENIQARLRTVILMAYANKFGHILLNASNKSEAAVGYGTLYGDMCGALSVLGDLYKTEVYALAAYINRQQEIIPVHIINKPPSAELRPDQTDQDSLPPYDRLDRILYARIEEQQSIEEIINEGFADEDEIRKVIHLVNISEHKRRQAPPTLKLSAKAFGSGRRMPLAARLSF